MSALPAAKCECPPEGHMAGCKYNWFEKKVKTMTADNEELDTRTLLLAAAEEMRTLRARVAELQRTDDITMTAFAKLEAKFKEQVARAELAESQLRQVKADAERMQVLLNERK